MTKSKEEEDRGIFPEEDLILLPAPRDVQGSESMKQRQIYYRRKENKTVIEGKINGRSQYIWTLPEPEELIEILSVKASLFPQEKSTKMMEKIKRLDFRIGTEKNNDS